uniref:Uncharacterized protein n=1 Tax=Craspedostauros australis TaxID=1486917 RepID=A0A7S0F5G2_9STRA
MEELEQDTANVEDPPASVVQDGDNDDDDDDDDDDAIEEVTTSKARDELMLQRQQQRESAALSATKSKKKKKKKKALQKDDEDDDNDADFDEDFFAQVDSMRNEEAKKKEEAERAADFQRKGKHTTFVVNHEETLKDPEGKQVDSNMRVVVLDQHQIQTTASAVAAVPIGKLSEEALLFSRGRLVDGSDAASKKRGRDTYWCRTNTTIGVHSENPGHSQRGLVPINFANTKSAQQKRRKQVK